MPINRLAFVIIYALHQVLSTRIADPLLFAQIMGAIKAAILAESQGEYELQYGFAMADDKVARRINSEITVIQSLRDDNAEVERRLNAQLTKKVTEEENDG